MGRLSRNKGANWEREAINRIRAVFEDALDEKHAENLDKMRRQWQDQENHGNPDVYVPHFHVECKVGKLTNPRAALRQATNEAEWGNIPVAICKDNSPGGGRPAFETVTMSFDDWLTMMEYVISSRYLRMPWESPK